MMRNLLFGVLLLFGTVVTVSAQTIVAAHAIRVRSIIGPNDITVVQQDRPGAITLESDVIGKEARVNLYAGRAIRLSEVGPPAILERNQLVVMIYNFGLLSITTEGRVLDRAGAGEIVSVMNLDSHMTVMARVLPNGTIEVRS